DKSTQLQDSVRAADSLKARPNQQDSLAKQQKMADQKMQKSPQDSAGQKQPPKPADDKKGPSPDDAAKKAKDAAQDMKKAADEAQKKNIDKAKGQGEDAEEKLDPLAQQLRQNRDEMRASWKAEVVGKMDHALAETSEIAKRQQDLAERMQRGDVG